MSVFFKNYTLDNGLTIVAEQRPSAVSVALGYFVKAGARDETEKLSGVSHFLEHMMFKGTEKRSALDITYEMGAIGAQANAFTSEENTVYYMAVLPEYFPKAFDLLSDMMQSNLDENEFNIEKKVILEEIALYQDRPTFMLFESALKNFFGDFPAGKSVLGTIETIKSLTRDEMFAYFSSRYKPSNLVLSVSGNFSFEQLESLAEKHCGSWKEKKSGERVYPDYELPKLPLKKSQLTKDNLNRAHVMVMSPGPYIGHQYQDEADVLSLILGDMTGSKIFWKLVNTGLADSASIDSEMMDGVGVFHGYASTSPENLSQVTDIVHDILNNPLDFSEEDLERAKIKTASRLVRQGESTMRRMMSCGLDWMYQEKYFSIEEELKRTKAVSKSSISKLLEEFPLVPTHEVSLIPA